MNKSNWTALCGFACALAVVSGTSFAPAAAPTVVAPANPLIAAWGHVGSYHGTFSGVLFGAQGAVKERFSGSGMSLTLSPSAVFVPTHILYEGHAHTTVTLNDPTCGTGSGSSSNTGVRLIVNIVNHTYYLQSGSPGTVTLSGGHSTPTVACETPPRPHITGGLWVTAPLPAPAEGICGTVTDPENYRFSWNLVPTTDDHETIKIHCATVPPPKSAQNEI